MQRIHKVELRGYVGLNLLEQMVRPTKKPVIIQGKIRIQIPHSYLCSLGIRVRI